MPTIEKEGKKHILVTLWNLREALREIDEEIETQRKGEEKEAEK